MNSNLNSPPPWLNLSDSVELGTDCLLAPGVVLGWLSGRPIPNLMLHIGPGARIRSGTTIYAGTTIGANLQTGHNVVIREENTIGDDCSIWSGSVVDYGCTIGSRVKLHCNVFLAQFTVLEDDVFMAPGSVAANDPHPGCPSSKECMRGPVIKKGAQIGAGVTLLPFVTIGEHAVIGSGSVVTRDIPPYALAYGNPARVAKDVRELRCLFDHVDRPYPS